MEHRLQNDDPFASTKKSSIQRTLQDARKDLKKMQSAPSLRMDSESRLTSLKAPLVQTRPSLTNPTRPFTPLKEDRPLFSSNEDIGSRPSSSQFTAKSLIEGLPSSPNNSPRLHPLDGKKFEIRFCLVIILIF